LIIGNLELEKKLLGLGIKRSQKRKPPSQARLLIKGKGNKRKRERLLSRNQRMMMRTMMRILGG
jgi:hypothetical protein